MVRDDLIGQHLGSYDVIRLIGRGGFARVYLATHRGLGRQVALKVLLPSFAESPEFVARFLGDAHIAARLEHPNIVKVYDIGQQGRYYYFAMAYVDGGSLQSVLRRRRLAPRQALAILSQIARALDYAHAQGVIHRDVKPSNILLSKSGRAYLADFGIARAAWDPRLTQRTRPLGTLEYMSPEQAQGKEVDARSDLYSLGVVLYEMICGRPPFQGENPVSVLHKIVYEAPPPPAKFKRGLSSALTSVLLRAIAKDPARRFQSGAEMAQALASAIGTRRVQVDSRRMGMAIGSLVLIIGVIAAGMWILPGAMIPPSPSATPTLIPAIKVVVSRPPTPQPTRTPTPTVPTPTRTPTRVTVTPSPAMSAEDAIRQLLAEFDRVKQRSRRTLDESELASVLTGNALDEARAKIQELRQKNAYWEITVEDARVETITVDRFGTAAWARVRKVETRNYYENGQFKPEYSESDDLYWVNYTLVLTSEGWRIADFEIQTPTPSPTSTHTTTPSATPTVEAATWSVFYHSYKGLFHVNGTWQSIGVVKGRVLDRYGNPIPGARVRIAIEGSVWDNPANPATTNPEGWYEFFLGVGQRVSFVEITVPGRHAKISDSALRFTVRTQAESYHHVDFIEQ